MTDRLAEAEHNYNTAHEYWMSLPDGHPDLERMAWRVRHLEMLVILNRYPELKWPHK